MQLLALCRALKPTCTNTMTPETLFRQANREARGLWQTRSDFPSPKVPGYEDSDPGRGVVIVDLECSQ